MPDNHIVLDALGVQVVMRSTDVGGVNTPHSIPQVGGAAVGPNNRMPVALPDEQTSASGAVLTGTARERFFNNFDDFNLVTDWQVFTNTALGGALTEQTTIGGVYPNGMQITGPLGGNAAGATPYMNIASGTAVGQTVILSRATFRMPVDLRYQISASQRIANQALRIGFVEVDASGNIVTNTTFATATAVLNARNAAMAEWSGATATTGAIVTRGAGSALETLAAAYGAGFTTVAGGTGPNFLAASAFGLSVERDKVNGRGYTLNALANAGLSFGIDRVLPNPTRLYKLAIIVENSAVVTTTDWRVHLVNVLDTTRFDIAPRYTGADRSKAFPVELLGAVQLSVAGPGATGAALSGNPVRVAGSDGTNTRNLLTDAVGNLLVAMVAPQNAADVASAALTTTTTTAAITPVQGTAYQVNIPVTAVTGTTPTLDVGIEESDDGGTNWFRVYDFPRITATGIYRSPVLPWNGNRVRYVQTVGGTTPSFTRAINRVQIGMSVDPIRQIIDRTLAINTLNSVTAALNVQNCRNVQAVLTLGAATTPPTIQIQGSDDNGANWYPLGTATAGVANATIRVAATDVQAQLARVTVSAAGTGATLTTLTLKGY